MTANLPSFARKPGSSVTMKDIAQATGVAQSTVSRILSGDPTAIVVTDETRRRVLAAAEEFGYRPNPHARSLRGASTMLLGVVVRDITDPFFAGAIDHLSREAKRHGYSVVLGHAQAEADEALALTAVLEARHCDAVLVVGDFRQQPQLIKDLKTERLPVVELWHGMKRHSFLSVNVDNRAGIRLALEHLINLGHSVIAFVGDISLGDIEERERAFEEFFGSDVSPAYVQAAENTFESGGAALESLLELSEPPTAIVAATDVRAIGVISAAARLGIRVPEELSVVGFDDIAIAASIVPPLTTLHMPVAEMSAAAIELAISARTAPARRKEQLFQAELVVRGSTAVPPATSVRRGRRR